MSRNEVYITQTFYAAAVKKGIYLVLLYADRVPPHIGLMIDNVFHSLTIKGQEINVQGNVLLKNIGLRKITTIFIKIKKHPVFSDDHLNECFVEMVRSFDKVSHNGNTCLSPVRLFFEEFYAIKKENIDLVFDLLEQLKENNFISETCGMNLGEMKGNIFYLQPYNVADLQKQIATEVKNIKL